jgi:hypothetical protein
MKRSIFYSPNKFQSETNRENPQALNTKIRDYTTSVIVSYIFNGEKTIKLVWKMILPLRDVSFSTVAQKTN